MDLTTEPLSRSARPTPSPTAARPPRSPHPSHPLTSRFLAARRPRSKDLYIPPFRQRRLDATVSEPLIISSEEGQKRAWTTMKKSINRIINIVNSENVAFCAKALFRLNLIRARGIFVKTLLRAQLASPALSPVFACLIAVIGSRLPQVAELLVARLIGQLKAAYENQDRVLCFATARFIAHLFNQQVVTDLLLLEFLLTCTSSPSDGSVELAVVTLKECTVLLSEKSPRALEFIFQRLRQVLHDGDLSKRVQVMVERLIAMRRKAITNDMVLDPRLDLLNEEDIITHPVSLDDEEEKDLEFDCNNFQYDPDFEENEREYEAIKRDILGAEADSPEPILPTNNVVGENTGDGDSDAKSNTVAVISSQDGMENVTDMTKADLVDFRRSVYLTINSGLSYEEWAHKLINLMRNHPGKELDLCQMIIECCSEEKTYLRSYGLLGQRFCLLNSTYISKFEELFATHYGTIHRFSLRQIRNVANFYASLFASDALPWTTFEVVKIVEKETTKSSRIFLKVLFQEIANTLGRTQMKEHFINNASRGSLDGLLPSDNLESARFAISFFKTIKLEYLTEELQGKLKTLPNMNEDEDKDASSSLSSSVSSSSLSSSSLSESSGLHDADNVQHAPSEIGCRRGSDESSVEPSLRPLKFRRTDRHRSCIEVKGRTYNRSEALEGGRQGGTDRGGTKDSATREDGGSFPNKTPSYRSNDSRSPKRYGIVTVAGPSDDSEDDLDRERYRLRNLRGQEGGCSRNLERYGLVHSELDEDYHLYLQRRRDNGQDEYQDMVERKRSRRREKDHRRNSDCQGGSRKRYDSEHESSIESQDRSTRRRKRYDDDYYKYFDRRRSRQDSRRSKLKHGSKSRRDRNASSGSEDRLSLRSKSNSPPERKRHWKRSSKYRLSRSGSFDSEDDRKR